MGSGPLEPPGTLCGNFGPAGPGAGGGGGGGAPVGSVPRKVRGSDGPSRQVLAGSQRGDPGAKLLPAYPPFCWLRERVWAWGRGSAELRGAAEDSLKPRAGRAHAQGRRPQGTPWLGGFSSSFWRARCWRGAPRGRVMSPWVRFRRRPGSLAQTLLPARSLATRIGIQRDRFVPAASGAAAWTSLGAGANSTLAGFLGMCLRC